MESMIDSSGGSRGEVLWKIGIARPFMNLLEKWIRKSSIRLDTKIRLHGAFCNGITPVRCTDTVPALQGFLWKLFCFHKYWKRRTVPVLIRPITVVKHGPPKAHGYDAFDTWALRKILRIPYCRHISNAELRSCMEQGTLSTTLAFSCGHGYAQEDYATVTQ